MGVYELERFIRAVTKPFNGAFSFLDDKVISYKWLLCAAEHKYPLAVVSVQHMQEDKIISDDEIKKAKILSKDCM